MVCVADFGVPLVDVGVDDDRVDADADIDIGCELRLTLRAIADGGATTSTTGGSSDFGTAGSTWAGSANESLSSSSSGSASASASSSSGSAPASARFRALETARPRRWCTLSTHVCSRPNRRHRPHGRMSSQRVFAFLQLLQAQVTREMNG